MGKLYQQEGNYSEALENYRTVLELDNSIELAHQNLMKIYVAQGDRNSALRQYQICVKALHDGIDSEPSTDTIALYEKIKSNQLNSNSTLLKEENTSSQDSPVNTDVRSSPSKHTQSTPDLEEIVDASPSTNLQHRRVNIIGREGELNGLSKRLERSDLVTLVGPGGCGKTTIAIEVGRVWLGTHPDTNVWFCEFASAIEEQVTSVVYGALSGNAGGRTVEVDSILQEIGKAQTLLIFDNCEHVIENCLRISRAIG